DYAVDFSSATYGDCEAGQKGEAIAEVDEDLAGGRGKLANGGGGSGTGQHGGSGGGNFGAGGRSAFEWTGCGVYDEIWSPGAASLDYSVDRIFLGGGGGGGQQDNGLSVTDGANGGGIVIINATTIEGLGYTIKAAGDAVTVVTDSEGAGGGGGGGAVILRVDDFPSALIVDVHGGDGGDIESTLWAGTCHGPGGGGGGGYVGFSAASLPATVTVNLIGGEQGFIDSPGAFCDDTPHGSENGADGGLVFNLGDLIFPEVDLGPDIEVCEGDEYILDAGDGYASYEWSTGETTQTILVIDEGEYIITVTNAYGCQASDSMNVIIYAAADVSLPDSLDFCDEESFLLDAGSGFVSYEWQDGSSAQTYLVTTGGEYSVTVVNSNGCEATVSTDVTVFPLPVVDLGNDIEACEGVQVVLDAFNEGASYFWNTGETTSSIITAHPGSYSVTVTTADGCEAEDLITILDPCGALIIPNVFSPNNDGLNDDFKPVVQSPIGDIYQFEVWSRWGELLFTSYEITSGWNGKVNNIDAEIDSYVWVVHYSKENSTIEIIEKGFVILVR
ncbi:MAG: gliding motility-associated C-terminal domain-containing protein, partial [Fimbriimonadaceae bacterium]|nr:gliding motility-associated C-terminal domain-containing protein [Chitinophagales bacterium]